MNKEITRDDVNNWLKENEDQTYDEFVKEYIEAVGLLDNYSKRVVKYRQKVDNLKQALIDIREYCKRFMLDDEEWQHDILQIIDKVLGDENNE